MGNKSLALSEGEILDTSTITSGDFFLTLIFPKNTSIQYQMSVSFSQMSPYYREGSLGGKLFHLVSFNDEASQLSLAANISKMISGVKGSYAFLRGSLEGDVHGISAVLDCYRNSLKANNPNAYCQLPNQFGVKILLPCRLIAGWAYTLTPSSDNSLEDQIQALAVSKRCEWCPNFSSKKYKKI